jgi:hypothetical protein
MHSSRYIETIYVETILYTNPAETIKQKEFLACGHLSTHKLRITWCARNVVWASSSRYYFIVIAQPNTLLNFKVTEHKSDLQESGEHIFLLPKETTARVVACVAQFETKTSCTVGRKEICTQMAPIPVMYHQSSWPDPSPVA